MLLDVLQQHWFNFIQTVFLLLGFYLAAKSYRDDRRSQQVNHLLSLNQNHQKVLDNLMTNPEFFDVLTRKPTKEEPITRTEQLFVRQTILQLYTAYVAIELGQMKSFKGIENDIRDYFSHAIPRMVWEQVKEYQDGEFVEYVERFLT